MVYVILADGFEEIEALTVVDVLRRAGAEVKTVGIMGEIAKGAHGICVVCDADATLENIDMSDSEILVFPGGMPGASNIDNFEHTDAYIEKTLTAGGYVAAICAAPMILGNRGYLNKRKAVCYPGFEKYLEGAEIVNADAVTDGKFITSRCMGTATAFALELVEALYGKEKREEIYHSVNGLH